MSPLGTAYPFGLRDLQIKPITTVLTEALGTLTDIPASRTFKFTESEDFETLRGDDRDILVRGKGARVQWELESGGYPADVAKAIVGGTLVDSGTTPAMKRVLTKKVTDQRPWFRAEGQVVSDNGGDVHGTVHRCRCTSDFSFDVGDGEWFLFNVSGEGLPSLAAGTLDVLYEIVYNETAVAITIP